MKTGKWFIIPFLLFLHTGDFLSLAGDSNVPQWSDQVEAALRVTPVGTIDTILAKIYFDRKENVLAISMGDMSEEVVRSSQKLLISLFDANQTFSIADQKCDVYESGTFGSNPIQFEVGSRGKTRLKNFGNLFFFDPLNYASQFPSSLEETGGIVATKWKSSNVPVHIQLFKICNFTHYITNPGSEDRGEVIYNKFVKIEASCVFGAEESSGKAQRGEENDVVGKFIIEFFLSKDLISNREIFQPPPGVYCAFESTTRSFPVLPPYFAFQFETFDLDNELNGNIPLINLHKNLWYSTPKKLLRKDNLNKNFDIDLTMIADYNSMLSYGISPIYGCNINELKPSDKMENDVSLPGDTFPLFLESSYDVPLYIGQRKRHGITFDVWVNRKEHSGSIHVSDYYFTNDTDFEEDKAISSPVFIELFIYTDNDKLIGRALQIISKYHTKPTMHDQEIFDVTRCFTESNKTRFSLTLIDKDNNNKMEIFKEQGLKNAVRDTLLSLIKVSTMRLGAMEISFWNEDFVILSSILIEDFTQLGYTNARKEISNVEAIETLAELVQGNKFLVSVESRTLIVAKLSFIGPHGNISNEYNCKDNEVQNHSSKFSSGSLAAIGITMLAIGIFQGVLLLVAYIRYRRSDPLVQKLTGSGSTPTGES